MVIKIHSQQALKNLTEFKNKVLRKHQGLEDQAHEEERRTYEALLHKKTGDLRFAQFGEKIQECAQKAKAAEGWDARDWEVVHLIVENPHEGKQAFQLLNEEEGPLNEKDFEKASISAVQETLRALNEKSGGFSEDKGRVEDFALEDLSEFVVETNSHEVLDSPSYKGSIDRMQAEMLLEKKPIGTYLFRDTDMCSELLRVCYDKENCVLCKGFIVTVKEDHEKVSEFLILKNKEWMVYDDDPDYEHQVVHFSSFEELLQKIIPQAKTPY